MGLVEGPIRTRPGLEARIAIGRPVTFTSRTWPLLPGCTHNNDVRFPASYPSFLRSILSCRRSCQNILFEFADLLGSRSMSQYSTIFP